MYFPKSQVKPNLYTNGGEYILSTTKEEYKGYYYKISTGQLYTGRNPKEQSSILLEPYAPLDAPNPTQNFLYNLNPISLPIAPVTQLSPTSGEYVTNPNWAGVNSATGPGYTPPVVQPAVMPPMSMAQQAIAAMYSGAPTAQLTAGPAVPA
jgi:hypothetical protein